MHIKTNYSYGAARFDPAQHNSFRSRLQRLTALSWLCVGLAGLGAVGLGVIAAQNMPALYAAAGSAVGLFSPAGQTADQIPAASQIGTDLGSYYQSARDRTLEAYLAEREQLLQTHFMGEALAQMQAYEAGRERYGMNRAGRFEIAVTELDAQAQNAQVAVTLQDWANDTYDVRSRALTAPAVRQPDAVMTLAVGFDAAAGRWKIKKLIAAEALAK